MRAYRTVAALGLAAGLMAVASAQNELGPGVKAPEVKVSEWVKGSPVPKFEKGRIYVVEFWATWCGPCIESIPHITELAKKHKDKVSVIGVSVWENGDDIPGQVKKFVDNMGAKMDYHVARDTDDNHMATAWMAAAKRQGIPSSFIVDGTGTVVWVGHPMMMEEPLQQVVDGTFNLEESKKAYSVELEAARKREAINKQFADITKQYKAGQKAEALAALDKIGADDPRMMERVLATKLNLLIADDFPAAEKIVRDRMAASKDAKMVDMMLFDFIMQEYPVKAEDKAAYDKLWDDVAGKFKAMDEAAGPYLPLSLSDAYLRRKKYDDALAIAQEAQRRYNALPADQRNADHAKYFQEAIDKAKAAKG